MDPAGVEALRDAIRHMHGCDSKWIESVPVIEKMRIEGADYERTIWEGEVQVFELAGHPKARRAYAWSYATEGTKRKFVAVLHVPPIASAVDAVRASIAHDA